MVKPTREQVQIRDHAALDLMVVAPAGCGKTEALALRVAGILDRGTVSAPQRVLVTTFSNRARDNIRDRLRYYVSPAAMRDRVTVANFHGLSARIFRAHAKVINLDPELTIPETDWVADQCRTRNLGFKLSGEVQEDLRVAKQQALDDIEVEQALRDHRAYLALEIELQRRTERRLTYDDLPRLAELILANDRVADLYRNHFGAVIVDEFQDLTPQQLRIVNRVGLKRTTYAGDLAQGIYGFAGAKPLEIDRQVRNECSEIIQFATSHRSAPAVLRAVNALAPLTGGQQLSSADPDRWPGGGIFGCLAFGTTADEATWTVNFARQILRRVPNHRIAVIGRTGPRRRFCDAALEASGLPLFRWDDGVLDTDTAKIVKGMLGRLSIAEFRTAAEPLGILRDVSGIESIQDPTTRGALADALGWCFDLLTEGLSPPDVRARIRVGDQSTLLNAPGVHLLTGHIGKGQQFDWVVVVGAEEGSIPDFRATSAGGLAEEARILSVMISRARHGAVLTRAAQVAAQNGRVWAKQPSRFWRQVIQVARADSGAIASWLASVGWDEIGCS